MFLQKNHFQKHFNKNSYVIERVKAKSGMVIGAGYGKMKETQIRIANFPAVDLEQVEALLHNLA